MEQYISKANTQLMARCFFNRTTGKVLLENYFKYYPTPVKKKIFN